MNRPRRRERGATLIVTLVMLIMLTLFAISAMNTSTTNLQIVGNMQKRTEALDATQLTIEKVISATAFSTTPANAVPDPCGGVPNTVCTDLNGDGVNDLTTTLTPAPVCSQGRIVKVSELIIASPSAEDVACLQAQQQGVFAVAGATSSGDSLCGKTVWDISAVTMATGSTATTTDVKFGATQGVGVRVKALDVTTSCP
ncbi:MAG TPA: PilX N-terminal domain-containing pilus assembly protein [Usitatibacter sp.]|nr:PilX N-terminal domain-containing pilus assembly protein [Usitatibacter sp.]